MNKSRRMLPVLVGVVVSLVLVLAASASAAPIIVNLRVEGSASTLFEGPVSTEGILNPPGITTESSTTAEPCDFKDDGKNNSEGPDAATPTAALYEAAKASGLAFNAEWSSEYNDFLVNRSAVTLKVDRRNTRRGDMPSTTPPRTWVAASCGFAPGSEVLWAYNYFNLKHLLSLSGPSSVTVGVPFTVHVVDGQTGEPISGAGGWTAREWSDKYKFIESHNKCRGQRDGNVDPDGGGDVEGDSGGIGPFQRPGGERRPGRNPAFRRIFSTSPTTTKTSSPSPVVDLARVAGVKNGHVYSRRSAPRLLAGVVEVPSDGTLRQVRISLQRRYHGRCFDFSGSRESFVDQEVRFRGLLLGGWKRVLQLPPTDESSQGKLCV